MRITGSRLLYFSHQRLRVGNRDGSGQVGSVRRQVGLGLIRKNGPVDNSVPHAMWKIIRLSVYGSVSILEYDVVMV